MLRPALCAGALALSLLGGCHLVYPFDVAAPDAGTTDGPGTSEAGSDCPASVVGRPCGPATCPAPALCVISDAVNNRGVCACPCSKDENSPCGDAAAFACGRIVHEGTTYDLCFRRCKPAYGSNSCTKPLVCSPTSGGLANVRGVALCLRHGCTDNDQCPVYTSQGCKDHTDCSPGDSCSAWYKVCTTAGVCDLASGLCKEHNQGSAVTKIGNPCAGDTDCLDNMTCLMESARPHKLQPGATCSANADCCNLDCESGVCSQNPCIVDYRNGYCTIQGCAFASAAFPRHCPPGSTCNHVYTGGACQRICDLNSTTECRGYSADRFGDYECRAWNNLTLDGKSYADQPVCDFGTRMSCSIDCADLGLNGNPTNMRCRSLQGKDLPQKDPGGYCLDDTSSQVVP
jgi:hypothetical protein